MENNNLNVLVNITQEELDFYKKRFSSLIKDAILNNKAKTNKLDVPYIIYRSIFNSCKIGKGDVNHRLVNGMFLDDLIGQVLIEKPNHVYRMIDCVARFEDGIFFKDIKIQTIDLISID
eukprot:EC819809.1.p1 GENE.EC819809.1~~EC819809.1.p1  ORF type:complete len:119 (+),score=21.80 EC819809.1:69-425(+)